MKNQDLEIVMVEKQINSAHLSHHVNGSRGDGCSACRSASQVTEGLQGKIILAGLWHIEEPSRPLCRSFMVNGVECPG